MKPKYLTFSMADMVMHWDKFFSGCTTVWCIQVNMSASTLFPTVYWLVNEFSSLYIKLSGYTYSLTVQVNWVGQTIGAIVANSHELARRAASAVEVKYEEFKPIVTIEVISLFMFSQVHLIIFKFMLPFLSIHLTERLPFPQFVFTIFDGAGDSTAVNIDKDGVRRQGE